MAETGRPNPNPQQGGPSNQGQGTTEGLLDQAAQAARTVAEGASELAQDTYERGARSVREGLDRYPEAGRYIREGSRAVSRPIQEYPLGAVLLFGLFGYLVGYLHGSGWHWGRESVPDYARRREYSRDRR